MTTTICGHDRDALKWALQRCTYREGQDVVVVAASNAAPTKAAWKSVQDPARLAEIIGETLRGLGVSAQLRLLVQDGEWPDVEILYFPNEHRPHVPVPKVGFFIRPTHQNIDLTMPAARALELHLLQLPEDTTAEDALWEVEKRS